MLGKWNLLLSSIFIIWEENHSLKANVVLGVLAN